MDESEREEYEWMDTGLEDSLDGHMAWMIKFKRIVYPKLEAFGFSFPEAVLYYQIKCLSNDIWDSQKPPNEDWEEQC